MRTFLGLVLVAALMAGCDLTATKVERTGPAKDGRVPVAITFEDGSVFQTTVPDQSGPITVAVPGTDATVTISLDGTVPVEPGWQDAAGGVLGAVTSNPLLGVLAIQLLRAFGGGVRKVIPVAQPAAPSVPTP